jgi:hypothetical protein
MNNFETTMRALSREGFWGPFLVLAGLFVFYFASLRIGSEIRTTDYGIVGGGIFLAVAGVLLMFRQLAASSRMVAVESPDSEDASYVVRQLSRNFEVLRAQTNQGFLLSGVFMAVGLLILVGSLFAPSLGLKTEGVSGLGTLAGIVTEFISGTALVLYRLNFARLNQTSDRLDDAWRVLAAYKLTRELPEDKKAEATLHLIDSLTKRANTAPNPDARQERPRAG